MPEKNSISAVNLPIVDYGNVVDANVESRRNEATKLVDAFTNFGFAMVENIDGYNEEELLEAIKWFYYDVTPQERFDQLAIRGFNPDNPNIYRGLFPLIPGKLSHKEGYDMGDDFILESEEEKVLRSKNPILGDTPRLVFSGERQTQAEKFYQVMYRHRQILQNVADNLMSMIAESGGEPSNFFSDMFSTRPLHTLRTIKYPVRKDNIPEEAYLPDGRIVSTPAHQDSGFLTLLQTFGFPGLEIQLGEEWFSVQASKFPKSGGTLVVNVGEQLAAMSNERFKATIHRVLDIGKDRFSMPYFYEPCLDTCINRKIPKALLLSEDKNPPSDISYGSFLLNKLPIYTEWSQLLEMLPKPVLDQYLGQRKVKVSNWASKSGIKVDGMSYDEKMALIST